MLYGFFLVIHILVSIMLVVAILMQSSKGGGLAGIAGGASSQAVFGGRQAATLLHKVTIALALVFGVNLLLISVLSHGRSTPKSVTQEAMQQNGGGDENPLGFLDNNGQPATAGANGGAANTAPAGAAGGETPAQTPAPSQPAGK